jgi:aspartyl-tRNA(Asn)/glutamyl-tRNA(Gln) amidotransferase subunit A
MDFSEFEIPLLTRSHSAFDNYFLQAQKVRNLVRRDFDRVFRVPNVLSAHCETDQTGVDVLIHPSAIRTAPMLDGESVGSKYNLDSYLQDVLTVPASLAGLPALSVPMGLGEDGWPVGVSLVGQWGHDKTILNLGKALGVSQSPP